MARRPRAVRLAVPGFIVAVLAVVALWRVGVPPASGPGAPESVREVLEPLTQLAEVLADNSIGRQASLENVNVREVPSPRTLWIGANGERVFVVLDPDVKNLSATALRPGASVTLLGLVRAAPAEDAAMRQWAIDAATAKLLRDQGTYLHVTEIRNAE
jgi:hypothetical protein